MFLYSLTKVYTNYCSILNYLNFYYYLNIKIFNQKNFPNCFKYKIVEYFYFSIFFDFVVFTNSFINLKGYPIHFFEFCKNLLLKGYFKQKLMIFFIAFFTGYCFIVFYNLKSFYLFFIIMYFIFFLNNYIINNCSYFSIDTYLQVFNNDYNFINFNFGIKYCYNYFYYCSFNILKIKFK